MNFYKNKFKYYLNMIYLGIIIAITIAVIFILLEVFDNIIL